MQTVLILAGKSERFWPLTEKNFFPVAGTSLLKEQVRRLNEAGIASPILVCGAHNKHLAAAAFPSLQCIEQEDLSLGMRGALLSALPHLSPGPVLIVSGNDMLDPESYRSLLKQSKKDPALGLILGKRVEHYFPGGYLTLDGATITSIVEKPKPGTEPSDVINIVAHVHPSAKALLEALKKVSVKNDDGYEQAVASLLASTRYNVVLESGHWQAVKYPWHLLDLLPHLLPTTEKPRIDPSAVIHPSAVIEGAVTIGARAKVLAHASVIGPCFIGDEVIVGNNALVRESSIGPRSVIGYGTEVARSILAEDVWTHMAYVGDSVIGSGASLGGGTITGNFRFDGEPISSTVRGERVSTGRRKYGAIIGSGSKTGVRVSMSPGINIGSRSIISAGLHVDHDVPDGTFLKMGSGGIELRENRCGK